MTRLPNHSDCRCLGLVRRRNIWVPTWKGLLITGSLLVLFAIGVLYGIYPFLAVNKPVKSEFLVVEGWVPDYVLKQGLDLSRDERCRYLLITGGTVQNEIDPEPDDTYAYMAMQRLQRITKNLEKVRAVPSPAVDRDRTYSSAVAVRKWLAAEGIDVKNLNVITMGPHARRSRLLFEEAFGPGVEIGIFSGRDREYDPEHWWRSSEGVKEVLSEGAAYLYARFLFRAG